jgi:chaperone required for assembly of F1-ATPase
MKRFYRQVSVTDGLGIALDDRPVKTPARAPLILPNADLARAVAAEWQDQGDEIDLRTMPLTGLANAAIDRADVAMAEGLAAYGETELLCYRADEPFALVARQSQDWNPILDWAQQRYDISFVLVRGIIHQPQPAETLARLREVMRAFNRWEIAAFNPLVTISGSLVIPLALHAGEIDAQTAFAAAHLDELWQEEQWGADELAADARVTRWKDFAAASRFLDLLRL